MSTHSFISRAFGLRIAATCPIPGLVASDCLSNGVDVHVWLGGDRPDWLTEIGRDHRLNSNVLYESPRSTGDGRPVLRVSEFHAGCCRFEYADGVEFVLDRDARRIWGTWSGETTLDDAAVYLLGPILGYVLRKRGVTCLHASVVAQDGAAIALVGGPRAGKSTTAAAFARRGLAVLSDDIAALHPVDGEFLVLPAYPQLRLWPDSVERLFGSRDALRALTPNYPRWDKRYLSLSNGGDHAFIDCPLPLVAIYVLGPREDSDSAPRIEEASARDNLLQLIANSYTSYLADGADQQREFHLLRQLVDAAPVRRAVPHANPTRIDDLCSTILADVSMLLNAAR